MLDILIRNGEVIDGSGRRSYRSDIGVANGRIAAIGGTLDLPAVGEIDATDLVVCPGFIDMHAHSDLAVLTDHAHEAKLLQGVTTEVIGQDGLSYAPVNSQVLARLRRQLKGWNGDPPGLEWSWRSVEEFLQYVERTGTPTNIAYLVPHGTVRLVAMGDSAKPPEKEELQHMKRLLEEGLDSGAVGMSAGLTYAPGMFGTQEELTALCEVVARYNGYYCPHHRNYGARVFEGFGECFDIAKSSGVRLHLTHANVSYPLNRGRAGELIQMVERGVNDGIEVTMDSYPYTGAYTYLHAVLPGWSQEGGLEATLHRLGDPSTRERIRIELEEVGSDGNHGVPLDWAILVVSGVQYEEHLDLVGCSIKDIAQEQQIRPIDAFCDLLIREELGVGALYWIGNQENVDLIAGHRLQTVGSDGILVGQRPHPRAWGAFPRFLQRYVLELGTISWEDAIHKMTGLPATILGLPDRGLVSVGGGADLVLLDPKSVRDRATYQEPKQAPSGLVHVIVNGKIAVRAGVRTDVVNGKVLRRAA